MSGKKNRKLKDIVKDFKGIYKFLYRPLKSFKFLYRPLSSSKFLYSPLKSLNLRRALILSFSLLAVLGLFLWFTHGKTWAAPWSALHGNWAKRKQLTLVNNSGSTINSNTTYQVTINTKDLYTQQALKANCDDIRVVYQPNSSTNTELKRNITTAQGAIDCRDSTATIISFPLQAAITNGSTDANYYVYYANPGAPAYSSSDALSAYNVGAKQATFVAPFNGTTTALAAGSGTPTTATGAIRYSGGKSALSFNGTNTVTTSSFSVSSSTSTFETWINFSSFRAGHNYILNKNGYITISFYQPDNALYVYFPSTGGLITKTAAGLFTTQRWYHIAVVYNSSGATFSDKYKLYVNGSLTTLQNVTGTASITSSGILTISDATNGLYGYLDEFRISDIIRYSSNFTPSTAPFIRDANTKLLLHFDENGDDPRNTGKAIDDSGNGNHGTITGAKYVSGLVGVDASSTDGGFLGTQSYAAHSGVFIEEGTTNKITNPSFENSTAYDTNWSSNGNWWLAGGVSPSHAVAAYQPIGASSLANSYINKANPGTYDATEGTAPSWASNTGWSFNGSTNSRYLKTGIIPTSGYTLIVRFANADRQIDTVVAGEYTPNARIDIWPWSSGGSKVVYTYGNSGAVRGTATQVASGVVAIAGSTGYLNGLVDATNIGSWTGTATNDIHIGRLNRSDAGAWWWYNGDILALAIYNTTLSSGQVQAISNSMNNSIGLTVTSNTLAPYVKFGSTSTKIVAAADATLVTTLNPGNTNTNTLSAYVYNGTSGAVGGTVDATVAKLVWEGAPVTTTYTDMGGGWWRLTYSAATTNQVNSYGVQVLSGKTIYLDGVQLEEKAYATTYADGSLGNGYSWSGVANNSTSSRTATNLSYAGTNNINAAKGTISFWTKKTYWQRLQQQGYEGGIFFCNQNCRSDFYFSVHQGVSLHFRYTSSGNYIAYNVDGFSSNSWHQMVVTWDGTGSAITGYTIYVDGTAVASRTGLNESLTTISSFSIGPNNSSIDGAMSDFRSYSSALSSTEVADLYNAGLGAHAESAETMKDKPSLYWKMDEGTGTTAQDSSGNNLSGVISSATYDKLTTSNNNTPNQFALSFNGTSSKVSRAYNFDGKLDPGTDSFSVSSWFRHTATVPSSGTHTIVSRYNSGGYKLYMNTSGYICFGIDSDSTWTPSHAVCSTATQGSYADSRWHMAEGTKDSVNNLLTLYLDGIQVAQTTITDTASLSGSSPTFYVGVNSDGASNYWAGSLDEVKYFSNLRSLQQIKADYAGAGSVRGVSTMIGNQGSLSQGLVGYWKMDEASWNGTTGEVVDSSGNGNNGTASGITGTSSGSNTSSTLNDTSKTWTVNALTNDTIYISGGTGSGQSRTISSNTATQVTVSANWTITPDATSTYRILPSVIAGKFGNGGSFDGTSKHGIVVNPHNINVSSSWSSSFWFKTSVTNNWQYIIESNNKIRILTNNAGGIRVQQSSASVDSVTTYPANTWVFVTIIAIPNATTNNVKIYINGNLDSSQTLNGLFSIDPTLNIGFRGVSGSFPFLGSLDEVRIYNRALSPAEVSQLYNWAPGPVARYTFEEGQGGTVNDLSGNGNTGTWGGTGNHWTQGKIGKAGKVNGTDDYVLIQNSSSLTMTQYTLETWFKPDTLTNNQSVLFIKGAWLSHKPFNIKLFPDQNKLIFSFYNNGVSVCPIWFTYNFDLKWHHFALSYNQSIIQAYVDGVPLAVLAGSQSCSYIPDNDNYFMAVGSNPVQSTPTTPGVTVDSPFKGTLDDTRIYNYARTQKQIIEDMGGSPSGAPLTGATSSSIARPASPVGYWKFDEGQGTVANNSGSCGASCNGTLTNMSSPATATSGWTQSGKYGKGLVFDGSDDYVSITQNSTINNLPLSGQSVFAWINPNSASDFTRIMDKRTSGDGWSFYYRSSGNIGVLISGRLGATETTTNNVGNNTWSFVGFTYNLDTNLINFYINGVLVKSASVSTATYNSDSSYNLTIGSRSDGTALRFNGRIDEPKIYNYALTSDEVAKEYNHGLAEVAGAVSTASDGKTGDNSASRTYCPPGNTDGNCATGQNPAPVAEWNFEEGQGSTVADSSGNNNTGTWNGTGKHWDNGKIGKAGKFIRNNDYVGIGNSSILNFERNNLFSVSAWIKTTSITDDNIISKSLNSPYTGWNFQLLGQTSNKLVVQLINTYPTNYIQVRSLKAVNDGNWHFVSFTYNGSSLASGVTLYIDGIKDSATIDSDALSSSIVSSGYVNIGGFANNSRFTGQIDQVRVYNYTRTPAQIAWDYNKGAPVAWWKMNECTGTTINDSSGNGNTGTLTIGASGTQTQAGTCTDGNSASAWANGKSGKLGAGLNFDGSDDYITYQNSLPIPSNSYSISLWFKPSTAAPNSNQKSLFWILDNNGATNASGIEFGCGSSSSTTKVRVLHRRNGTSDDLCSNDNISLNNWHHAILTYDPSQSSKTRLYVDGILEASGSSGPSGTMTLSSITEAVINQVGTLSRYFDGQLDDMRVYNYALSPIQVQTLYNSSSALYAGQ